MKKTTRNKTISLNQSQIKELAKKSIKLSARADIDEIKNKIIYQDCFKAIDRMPEKSVDLLIVDPPYNLTKNFSNSTFKEQSLDIYKEWLDKWLSKTKRILKDNASLYICSDWKTSLAINEVASKYFILQNRITWEREKGRGSKKNWKNCIEDIWFYSNSEEYKFNLDKIKIMRKVLAPYKNDKGEAKDWKTDKNGNNYRLTHPSNLWTDISIPFWSMAENTNHPTQKPEKLIAKLILASSDEGDVVFDPFVGSGTTAVVAKKLKRSFIGIEKEKEYVATSIKRLEMADKDKSIQGYVDGVFLDRNMVL